MARRPCYLVTRPYTSAFENLSVSRLNPLTSRLRETPSQSGCQTLIDAMPVGKPFDLVTALAAPLPVMVIAEMLGVEDGDMAAFKTWSDAIFSNIGDILFAEPSAEAIAASEAMNTYFS